MQTPLISLPPKPTTNTEEPTKHKIFYQKQFSEAYKTDERVIRNIISNNVECSNKIDILQFIPYYLSNTFTKLITKNNQGPPTPPLKKTNVIYQYKCSHGDCEHLNNTYIGMTTTTLSRRLTMHVASGGPKQHALTNHPMPHTREELVNNTKIIFSESNNNKLSITEVLLIQKMQPSINTQSTGISRTLKLFT